jgi:hypothetical protein
MTPQTDSTFTAREQRGYAPFIVAAIAVSLPFLVWALFARGPTRQQTRSAANSATSVAAQRDAQTVAYYGNGQLKVLAFYANPVEVQRGSRALVCYGVSNATSVSIQPPLGETWPSTARCLEVMATKDTEYKLTARDNNGHEEARAVTLHVSR